MSNLIQIEKIISAFDKLHAKSFDEESKSSSNEQEKKAQEIKKALLSDYAFYFQQKKGIFITRTQMKMMEMNPFFEKMDFKSQFEQMPYHDFLYDELVQDKEYKSKLTLCIDIMNVFLAKIDLNDQRDLEQFKNCQNLP